MKTPIIILCTVSIFAFGQKTKTVDVAYVKGVSISAFIRFNESNIPTDTAYYMAGVNAKYKSITDVIALKRGDIYGIQRLLKKCLEAYNEDDGTTFDFEGSFIGVMKIMGSNTVVLYGIDDDDHGHVELAKSQISKLLAKVDEYILSIKK